MKLNASTLAPALLSVLAMTAGCAQAQDSDWRAVDPENLLVLEIEKAPASAAELLDGGQTSTVYVELAPDFAPGHIARYKDLTRQGFYDGRVFHRVIQDFMAQAGGLPNNPQGGSSGLPNMQAEFTTRLAGDAPIVTVQERRVMDPRSGNSPVTEAGFIDGFPVAFQPAAQAMVSIDGKRDAWLLNCPGSAAAARTSDPNSSNFQFYLMTGEAPWLDSQYTVWGAVRASQDAVNGITLGEPPVRPDTIKSMRVAADLPEAERPTIEVMRTDSDAFAALVAEAKAAAGGEDINVCTIPVPSRLAE